MKPVKKIFRGAMTFASAIVLILALCTVDMELSLLPIVIYFTALAWIVYSINKVCKGGEKDVQN